MTSFNQFKIPTALHLLFVRDSQVLLLRRFNTGYEDGNYSVVAGHHDGNESFIEAAVREAKEEAGVDIVPENLSFKVVMYKREKDERTTFFFEVKDWKGEIKNTEPNKCDDLSWFSINNLPNNMVPYVREALRCYKENIFYAEFKQAQK